MKSKTTLSLMEQIIMLCIFAVAAAICIQAFVWSDTKSKYSDTRSAAAVSAQSVADTVKYTLGDLEKAAVRLGQNYTIEDGVLTVEYDGYKISVSMLDGTDLLGKAEVVAKSDKGEELFKLSACWQKGDASK